MNWVLIERNVLEMFNREKERWLMMVPSIFRENLFDDFLDDFFGDPVISDRDLQKVQKQFYGRNAQNMMKTDVCDHDDHYEVDVELPGFKKEDISLELNEGYLIVNAIKGLDKEETEEKTGRFVRRERYAGSMSRSFYVGEDMKQEDIHAKYESGVLVLNIPKLETRKPEVEEKKYIMIEG